MQRINNKPTAAQRAAQSARDKAKAYSQKSNQFFVAKPKQVTIRKKGPDAFFENQQKQSSVAAAYATGQSFQPPLIQSTRDSSRIVHRELVASITGSAAFAVPIAMPLNPGLQSSFPWLSTQAQSWETYRFNKLRYCYYTRTGSQIPGSVMLVPDYDALDTPPVSEQIASSYDDQQENVPWKDIKCDLRPSSMFSQGPRKFVRSGAPPAGSDLKTYDAGQMFVATVDGTAVNWGKLFVEYDITLYTPQLPPGGLPNQGLHITSATNTTGNNFSTPVISAGSSPIAVLAANTLTFSVGGRYMIINQQTASISTSFAAVTLGGGAAAITTYGGLGTGSSAVGSENVVYTALSTPAGGTYTCPCTIVTGTGSELIVLPIPSNMV